MTTTGGARLAWAPVALTILVVDQLSKHWAVNELADRDIGVFWTLRLNLSYNTGMAFSRGQNMGPLIGVVALVVVVVLLLGLKRQPGRLTDIAVGLIVGGAIGNVIDRLFRQAGWFRGAVVDFIDFQWFPIFNVADMGVTVGGAILILASWLAARADHAEHDTRADVT
ncbi:MAG: signal peptidase II [Ilumatobacteraceae bacterium]